MRTYWQCLIDCNAQNKNTGSTIRFCNLASSIDITYMPVAIEPKRFGEHKMYHIILQEVRKQKYIILQEVRKQSFGSNSSDSRCNRQRWQAPDVPAELSKRVICACLREICFFRDYMGLKRKKFSWSLLDRHLYTRQLACEPQTGTLSCCQERNEKTTSSLD